MQEAEAPLAALAQRHGPLREEQRQHFLTLRQDLRAVWWQAAAPEALTKRLLRTGLDEMRIDSTSEPSASLVRLHWHGGVHTALRVARHAPGKPGRALAHDVIGVLAERSKVHRDRTMAATLHRLGSRTGTGNTGRAHSVAGVRSPERLPHCAKGYDWLTRKQAAQQLGVSAPVVKRCIAQGTLPAHQGVPQAPWSIQRIALERVAVQVEGQRVRPGRHALRRLSAQRESPGQGACEPGDAQASASPPAMRGATLSGGGE